MPPSPPAHVSSSDEQPYELSETSRQEQIDPLAKLNDPQHTMMNLPNISISNPDGDKISQLTESGEAAQRARFEGLRYSIDMTGGSYKYAGLGLTGKLSGSVGRARAQAEHRLQEIKAQNIDTTSSTNFTSRYTGRSLTPMEKTLRDRNSGPDSPAYSSSSNATAANAMAFSNDDNEALKPDGNGVHPLERLRLSRSMNNLNEHIERRPSAVSIASSRSVISLLSLRSLSREMKKEHGEQAESVSVKFTGIKCTCGMTTEASSLCFQIVDPPKDFRKVQFARQVVARNVTEFGSTPEDRARGHGTPTLTLKGNRHPNPLRSNPVE
ncbi:hypothetical protein G6011_01440 [Alternaria panax]|uniref:Uncharacterized protein n=1 Tax=Alternaria panax TaxID=48097 RepID=A0AAD4IKR3_9PLEO|nr:hypothetical protein G6011_01440 [Alternaria panax]